MKTQVILIDFENVQPANLSRLLGLPVLIRVLLGSSQGKISLQLAAALQPFGESVQYIQLKSNGKNALDFHLAYYLGRLTCEFPGASFFIISKDTGFDPLILHLKCLQISCRRLEGIDKIPLQGAELDLSDQIGRAQVYLAKQGAAKPRKIVKLRNALRGFFGGSLSEAELGEVVEDLRAAGFFTEGSDKKLAYPGLDPA